MYMSLNTSDWWRLIRDFKNWFLHKSVQLGVSITDQIWLLSRTLPCFRSDSFWIKKGELAVLIMIIAFCCFLLSHLFVQGLFFPLENLSFFTSPPPPRQSWLQLQADFIWFLESAVTLAFSSVNGGPNKSLLNDTQNFLYSVSKASHQDFLLGDGSILNTGIVPIEQRPFYIFWPQTQQRAEKCWVAVWEAGHLNKWGKVLDESLRLFWRDRLVFSQKQSWDHQCWETMGMGKGFLASLAFCKNRCSAACGRIILTREQQKSLLSHVVRKELETGLG